MVATVAIADGPRPGVSPAALMASGNARAMPRPQSRAPR